MIRLEISGLKDLTKIIKDGLALLKPAPALDLTPLVDAVNDLAGALIPPAPPFGSPTVHLKTVDGAVTLTGVSSMKITDNEKFNITWPNTFVDKKGKLVKVQEGSVKIISTNEDGATVGPNPDDAANPFSCEVRGAAPADDSFDIRISADADLGERDEEITDQLELQVVGGNATGFGAPVVGTVSQQ